MNNIFHDSILVVLLALYTKYSVLFLLRFTCVHILTLYGLLGKDLYKV